MAAEKIEFGVGEYRLSAQLYRPAGAGPFPTIVAMHGCNGLYDSAGTRRGRTSPIGASGSRRRASSCCFRTATARAGLARNAACAARSVRPYRERVADAQAARTWLQTQDFVQKDRISLLGWSNGAIAALWTVRPRAAVKDGQPDFRSAVALYPGCRRLGDTRLERRAFRP